MVFVSMIGIELKRTPYVKNKTPPIKLKRRKWATFSIHKEMITNKEAK